MTNDHEASKEKKRPIDPKYLQPRWCLPDLSKTAKRRLQRIRTFRKAEDAAEKRRDELFNEIRPMQLPKQSGELKPKEDTTAPMEVASTIGKETPKFEEAPRAEEMPVSSSSHDVVESSVATRSAPMEEAIALEDDEEMVDFEPSPSHEEASIGSSVDE